MKITSLETMTLTVPFEKSMKWKYGEWKGGTVTIIKIQTDMKHTGLGEAISVFPPAEATRLQIEALEPYLVDEDPFDRERILSKIYNMAGWHFVRPYANHIVGSIEMALWDLMGKATGQPVYKLMGGLYSERIPVFKFLHIGSVEQVVDEAREAVKDGYETIYLKYTDIDKLEESLARIREELGYGFKLRVDFNQTLTPGFAVQFINRIEKYDMDFFEQPVARHDYEGLKYVRESVDTPIAANESSWTRYDLVNLIRRGAVDVIHLDPRWSDGLSGSKKMAAMAETAGMPAVIHAAGELGISQAAFLHVAASTPNCNILPNQTMYDYYDDDYIQEPLELERGYMTVPNGPGLGVELDPEKVEHYRDYYNEHGTFPFSWVPPKQLPTIDVSPRQSL